MLDGKLVTEKNAGADATSGVVKVDIDRLYKLIKLPNGGEHTLELNFQTATLSSTRSRLDIPTWATKTVIPTQ